MPDEIAQAAIEYCCKSVALTYNDPIVFLEYGRDVALECRRRGIKVVAVTSGFINKEPREALFSCIDAANIDLKAFTASFYRKLTGGDLQTVLELLTYLRGNTNIWLEITTLLIPGENDTSSELSALSKWVLTELGPDTPIHFSAFHPDYKMMHLPATPLKTLVKARNIALEQGLRYVYTGNVHYPPGDTTFCKTCTATLIERDWYRLSTYNITTDGRCNQCGTSVAGHFAPQPGTWGAKRKPIQI